MQTIDMFLCVWSTYSPNMKVIGAVLESSAQTTEKPRVDSTYGMASLVDFRTTFQAKKNTQTHFEGVSERFLPSGVANALVNKACDLPACQSRCEFLILLFDVPANPGLSH